MEIKELCLHGRRFTWTSETDDPTMTKIDHIFCTREWEAENSNCYVQAITSSMSDHCPMLLTCNPFQQQCKGFRFESFWTRLPGFSDTVQEAWSKPVRSNVRIRALHVKLARTARALKRWGRQKFDMLKKQDEIANEIILRLDQAQEARRLTNEELSLRRLAKQRVTGLAAVRRIKIRQRSRLTSIKFWVMLTPSYSTFVQMDAAGRTSSRP